MGFPVAKIPFYYAIIGDTSDNIPGVKGIGEKGAAELVKQFDSLQDLYEHLDAVPKERTRKLLHDNKENAFLSLDLFLLQYHPSGLSKDDMAFNPANWVRARTLFQELNFKSMLTSMSESTTSERSTIESAKAVFKNYTFITVTTREQLQELCRQLEKHKKCALDTEGSGLQPLHDSFAGISLCIEKDTTYYIPFGHQVDQAQLPRELVLESLKPFFENASYIKYLHNTKFDQEVFWNAGIELKGVAFDTMIAASLLAQEGQRVGLKALSERYFNEPMLSYDDVVKGQKLKDFSHVPLDVATLYSGADSLQTFRLQPILAKELHEIPQLERLFHDIEMPLSQVLLAMEIEGIYVNPAELQQLGIDMTHEMKVLEQKIHTFVPDSRTVNLNSPKQIEQLLFHELKLPPQKKSSKGTSYSTDQEVLEILVEHHPIAALILEYRELSKLKSTYVDALPTCINPKTGRVHTSYNQISVATGRLASTDPNLQNIPAAASGYGGAIRAAFKPKPGHIFLSADYSQIELRILAHFSQDENLVQAFLSGHDIHAQTASRLFDVPLDKVTSEQRQVGKRINFSILYGLTPYGLSRDLGISFTQAKQYITTYFEQYPGVSRWMEEVVEETKKHGFVTTWQGKRRYISAIYQTNRPLYEEARRVAINTKAQGTAADIMKIGMIRLHRAFKEHSLDAQILLQIHDELLISVAQTHKQEVEQIVRSTLEGVASWTVPLRVTTRFGNDWREASK